MTGTTKEDAEIWMDDVPRETWEEKIEYLCAFYDAMQDLLIERDIWKCIGDNPEDAAEFLAFHGLDSSVDIEP